MRNLSRNHFVRRRSGTSLTQGKLRFEEGAAKSKSNFVEKKNMSNQFQIHMTDFDVKRSAEMPLIALLSSLAS